MSTDEAKITEGRCGVSLTTFAGPPVSCSLPYGHKSAWHRSSEGTEWGPITPQHSSEIPAEYSTGGFPPRSFEAGFAAGKGKGWAAGVQAGREAAAADIERHVHDYELIAAASSGAVPKYLALIKVELLKRAAELARGGTQEEAGDRDG